jgi:hypothetical protein
MGLVLYIIALILTVLLMNVADMVHPTVGDTRTAVFLAILYLVISVLGVTSWNARPYWYRAGPPA